MTVDTGTRLGPYEVISRIGAGGMGEVFRARDTRLDRTVAIKVLPHEFADDAQLRVRFEREAKAISQIAHPNICTLHDIGHTDGVDYLVLEFLEGETLFDRIGKGALPIGDVLLYGRQIAAALDRAHRAGIVHRDLKPGNVMITKTGAKLLDFGLARTSGSRNAPAADVTEHKPLTQEGTVLGTYQYMSPEQLAGEEADERSDIFALGAVLYEMLTGVRAFNGKTRTSIVASIVASEPRPPSSLREMTPPALEHVIAKCLAKERDDRWQSAADVASELEWISSTPSGEIARVATAPRRRSIAFGALLAAAIIIALAVPAAIYMQRRLRAAEQPVRSELVPGDRMTPAIFGPLTLSPDGTQLALLVGPSARPSIQVRNLTTGETKTLAGTEGANFPFWSPDSQRIGFFAGGKMKATAAGGGSIQVIADAKQGRGGAWSDKGVIVFAPNLTGPLYKIDETGGTPVAVTRVETAISHRNPAFLPDGKTFLYTTARGALSVGSIDGKVQKLILENSSKALFARGRLFFVRDGNLLSQAFDDGKQELRGPLTPVANNVESYKVRSVANFSVTPDRLVYVDETLESSTLLSADRNGHIVEIGEPATYRLFSLSPDDRTVAVAIYDHYEQGDIWLVHLAGGTKSRLTFTSGGALSAAFSSDGTKLAFTSGTFGRTISVFIQSLVSNDVQKLADFRIAAIIADWSPDGKQLLIVTQDPATGFNIDALDVATKAMSPVVHGPGDEVGPALAPSGKWLAYMSTESGSPQVYVTSFPGGNGKWQATPNGGADPRWSRDGRQLFYVKDDRIEAVDFRDGAIPEFGTPAKLPVGVVSDPIFLTSFSAYAVTADGRFVTARRASNAQQVIHLVTNWGSHL
jgi:Tol biopolymer transport system component